MIDINQYDIENRFAGYTVNKTFDGSLTVCTLVDGSSNFVAKATSISEPGALLKLRNSVVGNASVVYQLTETQKTALGTTLNDGQEIENITTGFLETYDKDSDNWIVLASQTIKKFGTQAFIFPQDADIVFHEDDYIKLRYDASDKQFQFYPKSTQPHFWGWLNCSIFKIDGTTSLPRRSNKDVIGDDVWYYFTGSTTVDALFDLEDISPTVECQVWDQTDNSTDTEVPHYKISARAGWLASSDSQIYVTLEIIRNIDVSEVM